MMGGFSIETRDAPPVHLLVKIDSFSLLWKNSIGTYESREFEAGGHKWRLVIYPDGDEIGKKSEHVSVFLSIVGKNDEEDWEVNAMFNIFLFSKRLDNYMYLREKVRRFHALNTVWGFPKFISKKRLTDASNGYLIGDNCVFGAEVFVVKSQRLIERVSVRDAATPYKHDLVIPHLSKVESEWESEEFAAGDCKWKIKLYPDGNGSAKGRYASIFVECVDSAGFAAHEKVMADVCIRIRNKNHDEHYARQIISWFSSSTPVLGHHDFIVIGDMRDPSRGFVVDDSCFLEIEIYIRVEVRDATK